MSRPRAAKGRRPPPMGARSRSGLTIEAGEAPPAAHGGAGSGSCAPAKDHDAAGMGLQHNGVMSSDSQFRVFSALGHPTRYAILAFLRDREYVKVGTIAEAVNASGSTLSGHLRTLREAGLVSARRRGTAIHYCVNFDALDDALDDLVSLGATLRDPSVFDGVEQNPRESEAPRRSPRALSPVVIGTVGAAAVFSFLAIGLSSGSPQGEQASDPTTSSTHACAPAFAEDGQCR